MALTLTSLRPYQERVVSEVKGRNAVVVLPTGSGKTLIAAAVAIDFLGRRENSLKVLFLVPSCLLVSQQANSLRSESQKDVKEYMGGRAAPASFDILVSTPKAFELLSASNASFALSHIGLVIFDEVHHVIKQHPYRNIARKISSYVASSGAATLQLLGLTASLTYAVSEEGIQKAIMQLSAELGVEAGGIVTCDKEELLAGGYCVLTKPADVLSESDIDVNGRSTRLLEIPGKVHESLPDFLLHVRSNLAPIHPLSIALMNAIDAIESWLAQQDAKFVSPMSVKGPKGRLAEWGVYAHARKVACKDNALIAAQYNLLEQCYEACRIVINSRQLSLELAFEFLEMAGFLPYTPCAASPTPTPTVDAAMEQLQSTWEESKDDLGGRLESLADVLIAQIDRFGDKLRAIVFVQQRVATHIIKHFIEHHPSLSKLSCGTLYATQSPATASLSIKKTQSEEFIADFSHGRKQVLIATSVAEEGMNVPAANCVIRFDPVQNPVSMVQSRGRARQADSAFVIMSETQKRPYATFEQSEDHQKSAIAKYTHDSPAAAVYTAELIQAQENRVKTASNVLVKYTTTDPSQFNAKAALGEYAAKVKGSLEVVVKSDGPQFVANVVLLQFHVERKEGHGRDSTKKGAVIAACHDLLTSLGKKTELEEEPIV